MTLWRGKKPNLPTRGALWAPGGPSPLIDSRGAGSREVAEEMAAGAMRRFGADIGIGTTGVAGPGGGTPGKPVGTVYIASVSGEGRRSYTPRLPGDRAAVRAGAG